MRKKTEDWIAASIVWICMIMLGMLLFANLGCKSIKLEKKKTVEFIKK